MRPDKRQTQRIIYDNFMDFSITFDGLPGGVPKLAIAFGVFDGVHPGHRLIVAETCKLARERGGVGAAVTFVPHPRAVVGKPGDAPPELLISVEERLKRLVACGAAATGVIGFTPEFGALEPEVFLAGLFRRRDFELAGICVGEDWRFGRQGRGDAALLKEFCAANNLGFKAVKRLRHGARDISSSAIRALLRQGKLDEARGMLGSAPSLAGTVIAGFHIAGKELDAPTANLKLEYGVLPPDGVYAGSAEIRGRRFPAVMNIGFAPTYGGSERRIEIHLPGFSGNLYGSFLTVELLGFLRPERKFDSPGALKEQIVLDISGANKIFNQNYCEVTR